MVRTVNSSASGRIGQYAFTLVEVLMAGTVLAIIAVGSAAAMVQAPRITREANEDVRVRAAMRGMVAEISAASFSKFAAAYHGSGFDIDGVRAAEGDADGKPGQIRVERVGAAAGTYYVVTVMVTWHGVNGVRSISSAHYIANVRGDTGVPSEPNEAS